MTKAAWAFVPEQWNTESRFKEARLLSPRWRFAFVNIELIAWLFTNPLEKPGF